MNAAKISDLRQGMSTALCHIPNFITKAHIKMAVLEVSKKISNRVAFMERIRL